MQGRSARTTSSSPASIASRRMNNAGVALMKRANYGEAINCFTASLKKLKQMMIEDENEKSSRGSSYGISSVQGELSSGIDGSEEMTLSDPNHCSIFCQPVLLQNRSEKATTELYNTFSLAITFNLALAHHLSGMQCTDSKRTKLRKALRLYEFAYNIQLQEDVQLQITYTLGMLNNLGHIQDILGENKKAQQCFQHLLSTLMYVMASGEESNEGQWDVFLHNASHMILRDTSSAAAA